ncbi:HrcA family transcriptional regulator [Helicobacter suis]|uniref:HrcA family transcriptional regulator n=1 Tax=Helicobacter suis TaxID=104628 RepID=UPI000CF04340|nr:HrcA family transcriptional regulator [Helicobacter suis]
MGSKKEWLLQTFIKTYLNSHVPVGSESLRLVLQDQAVQISSATIRNYFKRLTDEGALSQSHSSSGRIPTLEALKAYWRAKLNPHVPFEVDLEKLQNASEHYRIFSMVERYQRAVLLAVYDHSQRFLILDFGDDQVLLSYNKKLERFLKGLVGLECQDIHKIASSVCMASLAKQIEIYFQKRLYFGLCVLAQSLRQSLFLQILKGELLRHLEHGLHFEKVLPLGFLGVLSPAKTQGEDINMFCVGEIEQDFEGFYGSIRRVS